MIRFKCKIHAAWLLVFASGACWATATYVPYLSIPAPASGTAPIGLSTLVQGTDGTFYAESGNSDGLVVSISPTGTFTTLHEFNGNDGENPLGALVFGADGDLYGTTSSGDSSDNEGGVIYKISTSGTFSQVYGFTAIGAAYLPNGGLVLASDGNFYGLASEGGANGLGALYRVSASGVFAIVHDFTSAEGSAFQSPLVLGPDGNLWSTSGGGPGGCGSSGNQCGFVYKVTLAGVLTNVYQFTGGADGGYGVVDGGNYLGGLAVGTDGNFYGLTDNGAGPAPKGTIFKVTPAGALTTLHTFIGSDGDQPQAALVQGPDGNFYGTTRLGGANNVGVVFSITPAGTYTVLHSFAGTDGEYPTSNLILAQDGALYGTTSGGGTSNVGTLYKVQFGAALAAPTGVAAQAGNAQVLISWTSVSGAVSYDVYQGSTAGGESTTPIATGVTATSYLVTGLTNGTPYFFTVTAVNGATSSTPSSEVTATPVAAPMVALSIAPTSVVAGDGATLTWSTTNATTCTASGATVSSQWSGTEAISGSQPVTTTTAGSLDFILTCSGTGGTGSATATLTVTAPVEPSTATPTVSPAAGTYSGAQNVTIADSTSGAVIYYTLDGSTPTTSSTRYSEPISVGITTTVKILAIASGAMPSGVVSATYTIVPIAATVVSGKSGGGAMGHVEILALLLLAVARVRRFRPSRSCLVLAAIATTAVGHSQPALAQELQPDFSRFYVGIRAGGSDYQTSASDLGTAYASAGLTQTSASVERHRAVGDVFIGVPFYGPLSIELGFVDLGEYRVSVQTPAPDVTRAAQSSVSTLKPAGRGATLQLAAPINLSNWLAFEPRFGLLVSQSKQEIVTSTGTVSDNRHDVGLAGGAALLFRVTPSLYIGGGADCFAVHLKCDVLTYTGEVEFHFGRKTP